MAIVFGYDASGRGNNWTANNLSSTAGAGNDSLTDTPTAYGTDTGVGGTVRGNYCTWNPLRPSGATLTNGNLNATTGNSGSSNSGYLTGTFWMPTSGKYYYEITPTNVNEIAIGLTTNSNNRAAIYYRAGDVYINGSVSFTGSSYTDNDVIGVAVDMDALTIRFYKNNTAQGSGTSSLSAMTGPFVPAIVHLSGSGSAVAVANFGQRAFAYTAPSGFKALCTQNLPTPTIGATSTTQANDYFNVVLYTGDGANPRTVSGVGFQPDFVWTKSRSSAFDHWLFDAVRGATKTLTANSTSAEITYANSLKSFISDGFTVGDLSDINANGGSYVAWNWKANGAGVSNTAGDIASTVSVSQTSGFSIVSFTNVPVNASTYTIGHGLGVAPKFYIVKNRDIADDWYCYHASLGASARISLNTTAAAVTPAGIWGNTAPTSSVFSLVGNAMVTVTTQRLIAYCFSEIAGYSAFGSYTGNGSSDGPFVFLGFRPRFVMIKRTDSTANWEIWDTTRSVYNQTYNALYPNLSNAEDGGNAIDINSNGFKLRDTGGSTNATASATYIYACFAENPFKYSLAR